MPISRLSATSCVDLELRPLPSTGVTRLRRYYGPLRHPRRPGLSLAGVRLRVTPLTAGVSRVALDLRVQACRRHYPGGPLGSIARGTAYSNRFPSRQRRRPSPCSVPGRRPHWTFRGLLNVHSRYGLPARRIAKRPVCLEGSDGFVTSTAAPIATGWSDPVAGWELHPLKINTFPRRTQSLSPRSRPKQKVESRSDAVV